MTRLTRGDLTAAIGAFGAACLGTFFWLFFEYSSHNPKQPDAALGFIHVLNNHGSHVYLTDAEAGGLELLKAAFLFSFLVNVIITGVARIKGQQLPKPTIRLKLIFAFSLLFCCSVIYFGGRSASDFVRFYSLHLNF